MSNIWKRPITKEILSDFCAGSAIAHMGVEITDIGEDSITGRMPVDERTRQPHGIFHGGMSCFLAETLGSLGASYACEEGFIAFGLDINANHLRAIKSGWATGVARPFHIGRSTQVWQIEIFNDAGELCCVSRLTIAAQAARRQV